MPIKITEFCESLNLKIFEKLPTRALCRIRSTCNQVDQFCEKQRYILAGKRKKDVKIVIVQTTTGQLSVARVQLNHRQHRFPNPFEELSALSLSVDISLAKKLSKRFGSTAILLCTERRLLVVQRPARLGYRNEKIYRGYSAEYLNKVVSLLRRLTTMERIHIYDTTSLYADICLDLLSSCSFLEMNIFCDELSYQRLLSLDSVKNARRLRITSKREDIPVEGFLKLIENNQKIQLKVGRNRDIIIQNVIPEILKDVASYQENDHLPRIIFDWVGLVDVKQIFPNHRLLYRLGDTIFEKFSRYCYAMALPHKIFLVSSWEYSLEQEDQTWTLCFLPYKKDVLKQTLFEILAEPISGEILDYMFESLMTDNK